MSQIRFTFLLLLITSVLQQAHLFAQHVPGTNWKQRETEDFIIIYPVSMSDEAAALAVALDNVLDDARSRLPVTHEKKKKWPLILTNLGLEANGFVTLAPRHSVWYATPGEEITAVSDWWMLLARHEARHMAQFDAADQGATRVLHGLFGELGWGAGIVLGTPPWLLEGDAVAMETALSDEGRGRDPLFTMEVTAMVSEDEEIVESDYFSAVNPSFKRYVPDYYRLGYSLSSWIRSEYGSDVLEEIYRSTARIPIPVIGLNTGTGRATDKKPKELYREMAVSLAVSAEVLRARTPWTPARPVSPENEIFTRYDSLYDLGNGLVLARKYTLAEAPYLVIIDPEGDEKKIIRLPKDGRVSTARGSMTRGSGGDFFLRIAWNSIRQHPVYLGSSVSDITIVDLDDKYRVIRRRTAFSGTRYLYPALSPDGALLAAVEILENGGSRLVILDIRSGELAAEIKTADRGVPETAAYPSWSADGKRIVFSIRNEAGRRIAEWDIGGASISYLTESSFITVKMPVYAADGESVFFSSNESGTEAIWGIRRGKARESTPYLVARRWYGAYNPVPSREGDALYLVEYSSVNGEKISLVEIGTGQEDNKTPETITGSLTTEFLDYVGEENPDAVDRDSELRSPGRRGDVVSEGQQEFPESDYRPSEHAFNLHSWGFFLGQSSSSFVGNELVLNIQSRDLLGTLAFEAGVLYEVTEGSPGLYADLSFTGIRPVIGVRGEYRYRSPESDPFHQTTFSVSAIYPANLARNGIWNHNLDIGISAGLINDYSSGRYPYVSYLAEWSRLREGSYRAIRPDLGWVLRTIYSQIPLPDNYGDSAAAELDLYFPGGFRNTALTLGAGIEHRTANFVPQISRSRGYDWEDPDLAILGTVDYEFPLGYPDLPLGSVIFIQRFRMGIFSDFGFIGKTFEQRWSTGAVLTMDFSAFNSYSGLSIGLQFSWRWQDNTPRIDIMVMDLPIY